MDKEQQEAIQEEDHLNTTWQEETQNAIREDTNNTNNQQLQDEKGFHPFL